MRLRRRGGALAGDDRRGPPRDSAVRRRTHRRGAEQSVPLALAAFEARSSPSTAGQVSEVPDLVNGGTSAGRFGWKSQVPTLEQFSGDAYLNEMGLTSRLFPQDNCPQGNCALLAARAPRSSTSRWAIPPSTRPRTSCGFWAAAHRCDHERRDRRREAVCRRRLRQLSLSRPRDGVELGTRSQQGRIRPVLRLLAPRHGEPRRRHRPGGRDGGAQMPDRPAVGRKRASEVPPRRADDEPERGRSSPTTDGVSRRGDCGFAALSASSQAELIAFLGAL